MFVILVASFLLAILFALSMKGSGRRRNHKKKVIAACSDKAVECDNTHMVETVQMTPSFTDDTKENQAVNTPTQHSRHPSKKIFVPLNESAKVLIVRSNSSH